MTLPVAKLRGIRPGEIKEVSANKHYEFKAVSFVFKDFFLKKLYQLFTAIPNRPECAQKMEEM